MEVLSFLFHIIALLGAARASEDSFIIEKEFQAVTCGSQVKLANKASGYRMHSHEITYSTGRFYLCLRIVLMLKSSDFFGHVNSGQQSITAFPSGSDPNSYFTIHGAYGQPDCARGTPFKCNDIVRLQHLNTQKLLHSHRGIGSPLSNIQEVSAYDRADTGDNWKVECSNSKSKVWERETPVSLSNQSHT